MGRNTGNEKSERPAHSLRFTDREKRILLIILIAIVFFFVLYRFSVVRAVLSLVIRVLRPLVIGCVFAFLMNPMMGFMEKHVLSFLSKRRDGAPGRKARNAVRVLCVVLSAAILVGLAVAFFSFVAPQFYEAVRNLMEHLDEKIIGVIDWADELTRYQFHDAMQEAKSSGQIEEGVSNAVKWITNYLNVDINDSQNLIFTATSLGTDVIMIFVNFLIGLFLAIYLLFFKESYKGHVKRLTYALLETERANLVMEIARKANDIFYGFIIGKILDSAIIGVICYFSMLIMQMPYPILCSFIIGVTNIIPVFGPYIGATPTVILIFVTDPPKGIIFLIYILILQQIDGNLIGPKILGDSTGITSFWVIIAVMVGGSLFGFGGMLIGVPTLALILYLVDRFTEWRVRKKNLPPTAKEYIKVDHIESGSGEIVYLEDSKEKEEKEENKAEKIEEKKKEDPGQDG